MNEKTLELEEKELYCLGVLAEVAPEACLLIQAASEPMELAKLTEILLTGLQQAVQERYRELQREAAA
jgi:hypothetical protein